MIDLQSSRDVKPIFLRSLAIDTEDGIGYPNFNVEENYAGPKVLNSNFMIDQF